MFEKYCLEKERASPVFQSCSAQALIDLICKPQAASEGTWRSLISQLLDDSLSVGGSDKENKQRYKPYIDNRNKILSMDITPEYLENISHEKTELLKRLSIGFLAKVQSINSDTDFEVADKFTRSLVPSEAPDSDDDDDDEDNNDNNTNADDIESNASAVEYLRAKKSHQEYQVNAVPKPTPLKRRSLLPLAPKDNSKVDLFQFKGRIAPLEQGHEDDGSIPEELLYHILYLAASAGDFEEVKFSFNQCLNHFIPLFSSIS